jgi:DNA-directed RNA polymerase subunit L
MNQIIITDKTHPFELKFDLVNSKTSLANAIRRICINEVPTIGFDTIDYQNSSIRVIENTTSLNNEFILHRIGIIPINIKDPNSFDISNYLFQLNVSNDTNSTINVTTKDFKVLNLSTNQEEDTLSFFPPDVDSNDNILIVKLKPNPNGEGEKINIEGNASLGNGLVNSRYTPTCVSIYINKLNASKFNDALELAIQNHNETKEVVLSGDDLDKFSKRYRIAEEERYFETDENDEPNAFSFIIESIGMIPSHNILYSAIDILINKLEMVKRELELADSDIVTVVESDAIMNGYDIIFKNESHTLGYLLQQYIDTLVGEDNLLFVAYKVPHPLKKEMFVRISLVNNTQKNVKDTIMLVSNEIIKICNHLKLQISAQFPELLPPSINEVESVEKPKRKKLVKKKSPSK